MKGEEEEEEEEAEAEAEEEEEEDLILQFFPSKRSINSFGY
jgi:hypothetical protein